MLTMTFKIGEDRFAIISKEVAEVLPQLHLRSLPKAPDYIAGTLNYHGNLIPVIDLCMLVTDNHCINLTSTRILVLHYPTKNSPDRLVGVIVENATETTNIPKEAFDAPVLATESTSYLGKQALHENEIVQLIELNDLLPESVQELLYPEKVS